MQHHSLKSHSGKLILFATILASGMEFLAGSTIWIALPKIQAQFSANVNQIQWIVNAYALVVASLLLISGSLGDHFGRKKVYCIGIALFTVASALSAFSPTVNVLIAFQALMGLGAALTIPESLAIINATFVDHERGRAIGYWSGMSGGVVALGPFLGGLLIQFFSWPAIYLLNIPLGILALVISLKFVPESKNTESGGLDFLGTALIVLGLTGLCFGLIEGSVLGWSNPLVLLGLIGGVGVFRGICNQ
jgi:MFS family permease